MQKLQQEVETSWLEYNEAVEVNGISISVFFNEDGRKFEIELNRKKWEEWEQPLLVVISNDTEKWKNPKLAKEFFKEALKLAWKGKSIQEIFEELETMRDEWDFKRQEILSASKGNKDGGAVGGKVKEIISPEFSWSWIDFLIKKFWDLASDEQSTGWWDKE